MAQLPCGVQKYRLQTGGFYRLVVGDGQGPVVSFQSQYKLGMGGLLFQHNPVGFLDRNISFIFRMLFHTVQLPYLTVDLLSVPVKKPAH